MDDKNVPYIVHEGSIARMERIIKRLVIALVIAVILIFVSNATWLYFWNQYDYESSTSTQLVNVDGKTGIANYIGQNGDIVNGEDSSSDGQESETQNEEER